MLKSLESEGYQTVEDELNPVNHGSVLGAPVYREEIALGISTKIILRLLQKDHLFLSADPFLQSFYTNGDIA